MTITRSFLAHDNFITEARLTSCTEEYGLIVQKPSPRSGNIGAIVANSGGVPLTAQTLVVKLFTTGDIGTSTYCWCDSADETANNVWYGRNPISHSIWNKIADNSAGTNYHQYDLVQMNDRDTFILSATSAGLTYATEVDCYSLNRTTSVMTKLATIDASVDTVTPVMGINITDKDFMLCLYKNGAGNYVIKKSTDGITWDQLYSGTGITSPKSWAYSQNYLYIVGTTSSEVLKIWQSGDWGANISSLQSIADQNSSDASLVVLDDGSFGLVSQTDAGASDIIQFRSAVAGSAFGTPVTIENVAAQKTHIAADNVWGNICAIVWDSTNFADIYKSTDSGATWGAVADFHYHTNGGILSSVGNFKYRKYNARPNLLINGLSTTYGIIFLEGYQWSNVTETTNYPQMYDAVALPNNGIFGWPQTLAGNGASTFETDLEINTIITAGGVNSSYYISGYPISHYDDGGKAKLRMKSTVGSSGHYSCSSFGVHSSDTTNTNYIDINVEISPTDLKIYDFQTSAYIGTQYLHDFTHYHDFLIAFKGTKISLWFREITSIEWINLESNLTVTTGLASFWADVLRFGVHNTGNQTAYWQYVYCTSHDNPGDDGLANGFTNPTDLTKPITHTSLAELISGVEVAFSGENGVNGDIWDVDTEYRFPKEAILRDSPSEYWRSATDNQQINFDFDAGVNQVFSIQRAGLAGTNFRRAKLLFDTVSTFNSGALATITLDAWIEGSTTTAVAESYIEDSKQSWSAKYQKNNILSVASSTITELFGIDDNDPTRIYCNDDTIVTDSGFKVGQNYGILAPKMSGRLTTPNLARYMRLQIQPQHTAEGYYKVGRLLAGREYQFGVDIDWGFSDLKTANIPMQESLSGLRYASKRGESRNTLQISWRGLGLTMVNSIRGMFEYNEYSLNPIIFWPDDTKGYDFIYGRLTGALELKNIVDAIPASGRQLYYDVNAFTIEEEL